MFELVDGFRCGTTHIFDGILVSQVITALDRVEHVPVPVVRADIGKCSIDPTLGGDGMRTGWKDLGHHGHVGIGLGQLQGGPQATTTGTDDQGIELSSRDIHRVMPLPATGFAMPTGHCL